MLTIAIVAALTVVELATTLAAAAAPVGPVALGMTSGGGISIEWILVIGGAVVAFIAGMAWGHKPSNKPAKVFTIGGGIAAALGLLIIVGGFGGLGSASVAAQGSGTAALASAPAQSVVTDTTMKSVDVTFLVRDEITGYGIPNAVIHLYKNSSGYTPQQLRQRTVSDFAICSPTDANGNCAYTGLHNEVYDLCMSVALGNYTRCEFGWDALKDASFNPTTGRGVYTTSPPLTMKTVGAIDLSSMKTTIASSGCTAGTSTCAFSLIYSNSAANSFLRDVAFKLTPIPTDSTKSTATNLTFASLQQGTTCSYTTIGGLYYVWNGAHEFVRTSELDACGVNLAFAQNAADGKITVTADDGFIPELYASMRTVPTGDFETNNNWPNAQAVSVNVVR